MSQESKHLSSVEKPEKKVVGKPVIQVEEILKNMQDRIKDLQALKGNLYARIDQLKKELLNAETTIHVADGIINELSANVERWK